MSSKRMCPFLSPRLAKKMKLGLDAERLINSFLMKPRDYYSYIHGARPRFEAYNLCLAAIENASGFPKRKGCVYRGSAGQYFLDVAQGVAADFLKLIRFGVQLSSCFKTISRKQYLLADYKYDYPTSSRAVRWRRFEFRGW